MNTRSLTTGSRRVELVHHKQQERAECDRGSDDDPVGAEPVLLLSFVQHHLERAHAKREHADAPVIDAAILAADVRRVEDKKARQDHRRQAHRQVDVEDPPPAEIVREIAADHGAEHRRHHDAESPERHSLAAVLRREGLQHHGLRERLQGSAGGALYHAEEDQHRQRGRESAQKAGGGEAKDGGQQGAFAAEIVGDPAGHRQNDRVGYQVRGQRPGGLIHAGRKAARDVRQRDVDHGGVQHLHKGGAHDGHGDNPRVDLRCLLSGRRHPVPMSFMMPQNRTPLARDDLPVR